MKIRQDQRRAAAARPELDELMELLADVPLRPDRPEVGGGKAEWRDFTGAVLLSENLLDLHSGDEVYVGQGVYDLWPISSRALRVGGDDGELAIFTSIHSATPAMMRGRVRRVMARVLRLSRAHVWPDRRATTTVEFFGVQPDETLVPLTNIGVRALPMPDDKHLLIRIVAGMQLHMEYCWTVDLRASDRPGPKIRIPTTPVGARQLLALRDIPDGRARRTALRHWVQEHGRRLPGKPDEFTDVRSHLRGATPFAWDGLQGVVRPSPHDLRLLGQL